ncbi:MAG: DUF2520 domain-containing protein [Bacteroidetes bacterium]|nr:MAG: DUF2520 domain-containing protein [Bacteroidota bacterium]
MENSKKIQNIGFIGSGKVATNMATALYKQGFSISQIYSPTIKHAQILAEKVSAESISSINSFKKSLDLIIISISDSAVSQLDLSSIETSILVCHTSGSLNMDVLKSQTNHGVFYPLQTFSNQRIIDLTNIPICVEANNKNNLNKLLELGNSISNNVSEIDSQKRSILHLAAVFVCNFTNAMYAIGEDILQEANIDFDLLRPLIEETANKVAHHSPKKVQTGPALRNDTLIMDKHISNLKDNNNFKEVYKLMSTIIHKENNVK